MFDIGFSELLLVFVIGLIVTGAATITRSGKNGCWLGSRFTFPATTVQNELTRA